MMKLKFAAFYGSVRSERKGIRAARFIVREIQDRGHDVELIEPNEYRLPLLDKMYKEYDAEEAPETLRRMASIIKAADAYVIVSGEYNHTIPPALSNLMSHFLEEYFYKPSGIVCYSAGAFGGVRAAVALRPMLAEMGMSSVPSVFPIPKIQEAFDEEGNPRDPELPKKAAKFLNELDWYACALKAAREGGEKEATRSLCEALGSD
jgi:NAD(P)H-dependent FMN reductase